MNSDKFYNISQMCKTFGAICKRSFYSIVAYKHTDKARRFRSLENTLKDMMTEYMNNSRYNTLSINYDYILDGYDYWSSNIASLAIVVTYRNNLLIYDIFADILYILDEDQKDMIFINHKPILLNSFSDNIIKFHGNMMCESLQLIHYLCNTINTILVDKPRNIFNKFMQLKPIFNAY